MGMSLQRFAQSGIAKAAQEAGLSLTADQVRDIEETERACLAERKRVSFGESVALHIVRAFAASSFITGSDAAEALVELTEAFYELREDYPAAITDVEILELLEAAFDGDAAGDVGLAAALAHAALAKQRDFSAYEIADDDGNVYRWDPADWRDDVMADGWCGERWEDIVE